MGFSNNNFISRFIKHGFPGKDKPPYYQLQKKHLKNVKVLPARLDMLEQLPKNATVAEIGVAKGRFSEKILDLCSPKKLHLVDSWSTRMFDTSARSWVEKKFKEQIKLGVVDINHGKSADILNGFPDNYFDWVYIDTDHTYTTTKMELELCRQKVKPGGIISGHDYTSRHYRKGNSFGVVEAVNEFCCKYNWEFVFLTHETHRHISFGIREIV